MKKAMIVTILVFVAVIAVYATVLAESDGEPVEIIPYLSDPEIYINSNQEVILSARWGACTRGLTRVSKSAAILDWTIDGVPVFSSQKEVRQYWGAPSLEEWETVVPCMSGETNHIWLKYWRYSIGELPLGVYEIRLDYSLSHPIIDGADYDGDGRPDKFDGPLVDNTVTVYVEDPPD